MRIKFYQLFGEIARIDGVMSIKDDSLKLEMAMTKSASKPVDGILKRSVAFADLEEIQIIRRFWRGMELHLVARTLEAFDRVPGASGFNYKVKPTASKKEVRAFVVEARLAIAEAAMDRFTEQL